MKAKIIASIVGLLLAHNLSAQQQSKDTPPPQYISASGGTATFPNVTGSGTLTLLYTLPAGLSGVSISAQGCAQDGTTCTSLTPVSGSNPYTGTTSAQTQFTGGYFQYIITATYTGTGVITVNFVGIQAKAGAGGGGGSGTVTSFSAGNAAPLFNTSVATATTTPALTFQLIAQAANTFLAAPNGSTGNPTFRAIVAADINPALTGPGPIGSTTANTGSFTTLTSTSATGPHWQSDATATPASIIDQVTSTNSGLTSGIPSGSACTVTQALASTTYTAEALCNVSGSANFAFYVSPAHAINSPTFTRPLTCNATTCTATMYQGSTFATATNCSSTASPAVCGSSAAGSVALLAATTTIVVNTTAVTANSQVMLTFDSSLGTKLGITCNTNPELLSVSARVAGTSFTITGASPATNGACLSYDIIN